jgi:Flp pilus assembly protein TadD
MRAQALTGASIAAGHSWNLGPAGWLLNVLALLADYLRLLLVPVGMAYWHPFEPVASFATAEGAVALLVGTALAAAAWIAWRRSRLAFLALAWIVVPLAPTFLLDRFPRTPFAERYLYLSVLGFALLVALGYDALAGRRALRGVAASVLLLLAAGYATATVARNQVWKDAYTLFLDSVRKAPDTPRPPVALASKLVERGRFEEALAHHRILVAMEPDNPRVHSAMAGALSVAGRSDEALVHFEKAVALAPEDPFLHNLLGIEHARRGELEDAREHLQIATRLAPGEPAYRNNLERLGPPAP